MEYKFCVALTLREFPKDANRIFSKLRACHVTRRSEHCGLRLHPLSGKCAGYSGGATGEQEHEDATCHEQHCAAVRSLGRPSSRRARGGSAARASLTGTKPAGRPRRAARRRRAPTTIYLAQVPIRTCALICTQFQQLLIADIFRKSELQVFLRKCDQQNPKSELCFPSKCDQQKEHFPKSETAGFPKLNPSQETFSKN